MKYPSAVFALLLPGLVWGSAIAAEKPTVETVLGAVVSIQSETLPDARTAKFLGRKRQGSGVVIDSAGLIVTIGHLVLEAGAVTVTTAAGKTVPAHVVAYDHPTGLGLIRAEEPLDVRPMPFANSSRPGAGDLVLVAGAGGAKAAMKVRIVARRPFVGYWEYMLDEAIFTMPPYADFRGAALFDAEGRLLGIGSLHVQDAVVAGQHGPGNMFVPVDLLRPILAELIADGRSRQSMRPWVGMIIRETQKGLFVAGASQEGPADAAGIRPGSILVALEGRPIQDLADFYRRLWSAGPPGVAVHLTLIEPGGEPREAEIVTRDRYDWLTIERSE